MKKFAAAAHNYRLLHDNERKDLKNKNQKLQAWQKVAKWLWKSSFFFLFLKMSRTQKRFIFFVSVCLVRLLRLRKQKKQQDLRMKPAIQLPCWSCCNREHGNSESFVPVFQDCAFHQSFKCFPTSLFSVYHHCLCCIS